MSRKVINAREYAWGDIQVWLYGRMVGGCTGISYKLKKGKEAVFGAGRHARGMQHGRVEVEGTLTILQSELIALTRAVKAQGYDSLLDVELDIVISYAPKVGPITTDKVYSASFSELPTEFKENDFKTEIALPFIGLAIEHDI